MVLTILRATGVVTKANPNSCCQGIRKLLGHRKIRESARKSPGKYLNSAGYLEYLCLRCSGGPQEENKITNFVPSVFCFLEFPGKNHVFLSNYGNYHEFTRKLLESHPESGSGNYLEGTRNSGLP
jgi:hypothetical protein